MKQQLISAAVLVLIGVAMTNANTSQVMPEISGLSTFSSVAGPVTQDCPGGICPIPQIVSITETVQPTVQRSFTREVQRSSGSICPDCGLPHGVQSSTAMSRQVSRQYSGPVLGPVGASAAVVRGIVGNQLRRGVARRQARRARWGWQ